MRLFPETWKSFGVFIELLCSRLIRLLFNRQKSRTSSVYNNANLVVCNRSETLFVRYQAPACQYLYLHLYFSAISNNTIFVSARMHQSHNGYIKHGVESLGVLSLFPPLGESRKLIFYILLLSLDWALYYRNLGTDCLIFGRQVVFNRASLLFFHI
jgi:hypothetical protein